MGIKKREMMKNKSKMNKICKIKLQNLFWKRFYNL